jgi:hypothetical protein
VTARYPPPIAAGRSPITRRAVVLVLAVLAGLLAGCSDGEGTDDTGRRTEIYGLVLDWVLHQVEFPPPTEGDEPDETPTVFVDHLNRDISLDVQVGLVAMFEEGYDLRFVDALSEAIDEDAPRSPVRGEAVLVGLGPIPDSGPYLVRAEVYHHELDIEAFRFEVIRRGGEWVRRGEPEPVEPEGFVPGG